MAGKANSTLLDHGILLDNINSTQLVEEDLFDMMTALVTLFHKWKEIGTALGLRHYILEIIEAKCRTNVRLALQEVMVEFVRKNYNCDRFGDPSWQSLAKAVAHPVGGADVPVALEIANAHPAKKDQASSPKPASQQEPDHIYSVGCPVHLLKYDWYHGELSLADAAKLLISKGGSCFLVREDKDNAGIVLSVKGEGGVAHLTVNRGPGWYAVEGTTKQFETVAELVTYHQTNSLVDNSSLGSPCLRNKDSTSAASSNASEGLYQVGAPSELLKHSWYAGKLSREAAQEKLSAAEDSRFLVWVDDNSELFLSLKRPNETSHLKIERGPGWYTVEGTFQLHPTVPDLVHYYNLDLFPAAPDVATYYNLNGSVQSGVVRAQHIYEYIDVKTTKPHEYDYIRVGEHSKNEYDYIRVGENAKHVYDVVQAENNDHVYEYVSSQTIQEDIKKSQSKSGKSAVGPDCWFHGGITRERAAYLVSTGPIGRREGLFLVRDSLRSPGSFVLTFWAKNQAHHFQIVSHGDGWYSVDNGPLFQGVDELVKHYLVRSDGLPSKLQEFVTGSPLPGAARRRVDTEYHKAAREGDVVLLRQLLSQQSSVTYLNSRNPDGSTLVHEAAKRGNVKVLLLLLEHKAEVNEVHDNKGCTALQLAARNGHAEAVRVLVEKGGANVQDRNETTGWVALHDAAFRGHADCVKVLLQSNAPLRPRTPDEDTPRELAVRYKQKAVVDVLDWASQNFPKPQTQTHEWLHKKLSRTEAVDLLQRKGNVHGSFLIRPNTRRPGYYALSVIFNSEPYNLEVVCEGDHWYFIDDGPLFTSLPELVDHHMRFKDGLLDLLRFPVPPRSSPGDHSLGWPASKPTPTKRKYQFPPSQVAPTLPPKAQVVSSGPTLPPKPQVVSSGPKPPTKPKPTKIEHFPSKPKAHVSAVQPPPKPKPTKIEHFPSKPKTHVSAVQPPPYK